MKILLFGKQGQIGWELQRSLAPLGELVALDSRSQEYGGNLAHLDQITRTIHAVSPDVIVNAAGYTAVDQAETNIELARALNTAAPALLAQQARRCNAWLIHYSTDYVFDGSGDAPWKETDNANPLSVYGKTKLAGDIAIRESGCKHLIFRTSWVYGAHGGNFAKTMLRLAQERAELNIVNDQFGAPTGAELIADVTAHGIRQAWQQPTVSGLYHLAAAGVTSWFDYAKVVIEWARAERFNIHVATEAIRPVPATAFAAPARRPANSCLDTHHLQTTFGLQLPHWQTGVVRMLQELSEEK